MTEQQTIQRGLERVNMSWNDVRMLGAGRGTRRVLTASCAGQRGTSEVQVKTNVFCHFHGDDIDTIFYCRL